MRTRLVSILAAITGCAGITSGILPKPRSPDASRPQDEPITDDVHRQHAGQVVFARVAVPATGIDASTLTTTATLDDEVWARAFFARSPANTIADADPAAGVLNADGSVACNGHFRWEVRDGRNPEGQWTLLYAERDNLGFSTHTTAIMGSNQLIGGTVEWLQSDAVTRTLAVFLEHAARGAVPLQVRLRAGCLTSDSPTPVAEHTMAEGTLILDNLDADYVRYLARIIKLPTDAFADAAEAKKIKTEVARTQRDAKVLWVRIPDRDWTIEHDDNGLVLRRTTDIVIALQTGEQCILHTAAAVEAYAGGGTFTSTPAIQRSQLSIEPDRPMPCAVFH